MAFPPALSGCGFLSFRHLLKPHDSSARKILLLGIESASWIAIARFLFFVSSINLMTPLERVRVVSMVFLVSRTVFVPVVLLRRTALERRLGRLSTLGIDARESPSRRSQPLI